MDKNKLKKDKKKKIIIAEDEKEISEMYKDKLKQEGYDVLCTYDGKKTLEIAKKEKPDLLFLDILMPKKEGFEVLKEIRESGDWGKKVPVVMLTNLDADDDILDSIAKYHPSYYFIKANIKIDEIVSKTKELLKD